MPELVLDRDLRLALRAQAHPLHPVVLLGGAGLSDAVLREIDRALRAHSLIKVRIPGDDRAERETLFATIAERLGAGRVQMIGKLLVLYRPPVDDPPPAPPPRRRADRPSRAERPSRADGGKRRRQT